MRSFRNKCSETNGIIRIDKSEKIGYIPFAINRKVSEIMDELLNILYDLFPDVDFDEEDRLVDDGLLDTDDIESICDEIEEQFGVAISEEYQNATYFNSAEDLYELIQNLES